jgi:hypothetical protein
MELFWQGITTRKEDITTYGHFSGTGIVLFDENLKLTLE